MLMEWADKAEPVTHLCDKHNLGANLMWLPCYMWDRV